MGKFQLSHQLHIYFLLFFFSKITVDFYIIIFLLKNDLLWSSETIQEAEKFSPSGNPKAE